MRGGSSVQIVVRVLQGLKTKAGERQVRQGWRWKTRNEMKVLPVRGSEWQSLLQGTITRGREGQGWDGLSGAVRRWEVR